MAQAKKSKTRGKSQVKKSKARVAAKPNTHLTHQYLFLIVLVALLILLVMYVNRRDNPYNIQQPHGMMQPDAIDPSTGDK